MDVPKKHHEEELTHHAAAEERTYFGFWIYLMTDLIMFSVLFAAYAVLRTSTHGGPGPEELFSLPLALSETLLLLTSSFTCGLGVLSAARRNKRNTLLFFGVTFLLGIAFLWLELTEFSQLIAEGNGFARSAFLSSFFALVGTHGLHILSGLLWMVVTFVYLLRRGMTDSIIRKLTLLGVFWHFLDVVWIFIFTIVYLMGVIL
jgi:cytochrome o ubiquinol oxidase subunit III